MRHLLIHPPFADPTQPYLSLPTLKGALRARGLDARVVDLNVEAAHWLFERETLESVARRVGSRFIDLNRTPELDFQQQLEFRRIVDARPKVEQALGAEPSPIEVFQERELFFDPAQYALARRRVEGFFDALSAAYWPYVFSFNHAAHAVVPWSFDLLEEYASGGSSPLTGFYERFFSTPDVEDWSAAGRESVDLEDVAFLGVSVVFPSQIPEAFHLLRFLRERAPHAFLALGGPCIHQVVVHLEPELQRRVLAFVDGVGLFESEETLAQLLPRLDAWRAAGESDLAGSSPDPVRTSASDRATIGPRDLSRADDGIARARFELLKDVPNLLLADPATGAPVLGPRWTLDLREAEAPDYSDLDLDRYLAPSRTLLYAPTRGCYWGKCSFCYYGLAETATASYREIPPERAAAQLARLARTHGVKNFYVSCDVLSPSYAVRLAQALIDKKVKIRWSSDLKIEKYFTPERCALLHQSGLRSAAFGIESGSDRILDLMRKGCDRATMTEVNRSFHQAGVATEWMTFTDHPGETVEEALATVRWIEEESEFVDLFIVGRFGLERGSHVAQEPARYGVRKVYYAEGDELRLYAMYKHRSGRRSPELEARVEREIGRVAAPYDLHSYPWAGACSTHHTFLHLLELGPNAFKTHFRKAGAARDGALPMAPSSHITGLRERPRFDVAAIAEREREFLGEYLERALYTTIPSRRVGGAKNEVAPLSAEDFAEAAAEIEPLRSGKQ